jgi:hypothetical protein
MAMPFAWVETEEAAESLVVLHCALNSVRKVYQVRVEWDTGSAGGIREAVRRCRERFGFPPLD